MLSFRTWCEQEQKSWKAKKKDILQFWQGIPPSLPIQFVNIVPKDMQGSTYPYDGLRVTGSGQFINGVISRLKDIIPYEGKNSKLHLIYRQQVDKKTNYPLPNSFVFYVQAKERKNEL